MDISKLKVPDLKRELKSRGLSTSGNKTDLMDRLQNAIKLKMDDAASAESVDDLDEDLLNDDDLDHEQLEEASESVLKELDEDLDVSPTVVKTPKRKLDESKSTDSDSKPKKIVLNRTPSVSSESSKDNQNGVGLNTSTNTNRDADDSNEKKVVKLSELSLKERLEMRAKKFGVAAPDEVKKLARAERFSLGSTDVSSPAASALPTESASLDVLKKRAERFGGSVSKTMSGLEQQQRLENRKARFGVVTTSNGTSVQTEKAKQRLERFKTAVK